MPALDHRCKGSHPISSRDWAARCRSFPLVERRQLAIREYLGKTLSEMDPCVDRSAADSVGYGDGVVQRQVGQPPKISTILLCMLLSAGGLMSSASRELLQVDSSQTRELLLPPPVSFCSCGGPDVHGPT